MGIFSKIKQGLIKTKDSISKKLFEVFSAKELDDDFYDELEMVLISADVGVKTTEKIIARLKEEVRARREGNPENVRGILKEIVAEMMESEPFRPQSPSVVLVVGVNGVGKTTTIGKLGCYFKEEGKNVILAAADTFRAAATEQLTIWAERAGVPIVAHGEGADPAAVVFDAVASAKAKKADLLIVDTAGRLHNKAHLMEELKKIRRVIDRDFPEAQVHVLLVLDGTTGQNGVTQARVFRDAVQLSGIVLTKLDGTAKGGVVVSIKEELQLPVYFVGVGEQKEDLQVFHAKEYAEAIF